MTVRLLASAFLLVAFVSCRSASPSPAERPTIARFFLEAADARSTSVTLPRSGVQIAVNAQPVITEGDLADVALAQVELGRCLRFQVNSSALRDVYRLTGAHQGRRLVLMVNDEPIGARRIDGPIADGVLFIFVEVADDALPRLVDELKRTTLRLQRENARK